MPRIGGAGQGFTCQTAYLLSFKSLSVEAGIDSLMQTDEVPAGSNDPLAGMADEIRRRAQTSRDQFIPWDGEAMAERIKAKLDRA